MALGTPDGTDSGNDTAADADGSALPDIQGVRPRAYARGTDDPAVELRFENGGRIRYRATAEGIREEWFGPDDDEPARSSSVSVPVAHGAEGRGDADPDGRPSTRVLADRALCTLGTYLEADGRPRAEFVWGEENVNALLGKE